MKKGTHDNDDEPLSFQSLGLAAAIVLNRIRNAQALRELAKLDEEKQECPDKEGSPSGGDERPSKEHAEAVQERLRSINAFERRARGQRKY